MSERRTHEAVIDELVGAGLLQPRPRRFGIMAWALLLPCIVQTIGLCCLGIVAFSLTEMSALPAEYRTWLVVVGSFTVAIGSSVGSLPSAIEIFRKRRRGEAEWPDWAALVFSGCASLAETITALSFLGGFDIVRNLMRVIILGTLTVLDAYFTISELGDWIACYEVRIEKWREEYRQAVDRFYAMENGAQSELEPSSSSAGPCWCGTECRNRQHYAAHVQHVHYPEIAEYDDGVQARETMRVKYAETIPGAAWDFPTLEWFNRVKERSQ